MLAFHQTMLGNLTTYAFSDFKSAPQVTTSYITANVVAGVLRLPLAKTLNLWGRAEGLLISLLVYVIGMIILAACNGPDAYVAGYTLYWIGYDCIYLILEIFIVDTTGLRNRAWAFAFSTTPFICTAFTAPLAANSFLVTSGWRWAFGHSPLCSHLSLSPWPLCSSTTRRRPLSWASSRRRRVAGPPFSRSSTISTSLTVSLASS